MIPAENVPRDTQVFKRRRVHHCIDVFFKLVIKKRELEHWSLKEVAFDMPLKGLLPYINVVITLAEA